MYTKLHTQYIPEQMKLVRTKGIPSWNSSSSWHCQVSSTQQFTANSECKTYEMSIIVNSIGITYTHLSQAFLHSPADNSLSLCVCVLAWSMAKFIYCIFTWCECSCKTYILLYNKKILKWKRRNHTANVNIRYLHWFLFDFLHENIRFHLQIALFVPHDAQKSILEDFL